MSTPEKETGDKPIGLNTLQPAPGSRKPRKRVGRGEHDRLVDAGLGVGSGDDLGGGDLGLGARDRLGGGLLAGAQPEHLVDRQAAQLRDLLGAAQALQAGDRRLDEVDRVLRAERPGQDVVDPGELEHRAHAAAGDDAGTG